MFTRSYRIRIIFCRSIWPIDRTLPLRVRVYQGVMAMKGHSTLTRSPELALTHHSTQFRVMFRRPLFRRGVSFLCRGYSQCVCVCVCVCFTLYVRNSIHACVYHRTDEGEWAFSFVRYRKTDKNRNTFFQVLYKRSSNYCRHTFALFRR